MATHEVTTFDVCASGFERLRSYEEYILSGPIDAETTADELLSQWLDDLNVCDRGDGFDYDAAREAITSYHAANVAPRFTRENPFDLEPVEDKDFDWESGCAAYLYIRVEGAHFPVY